MILTGKGKLRKQKSIAIRTPLVALGDDPTAAAPDWASSVATEALRIGLEPSDLPAAIRDCYVFPFIEKMMLFAPQAMLTGFNPAKHIDMNLTVSWSGKTDNLTTRSYIDPLLLGGAPYDMIAKLVIDDGSVPASAVETYERLHFNCRAADGAACLSAIRSHMLAFGGPGEIPNTTQGHMRAIGLLHGYTALAELLGFWDVAGQKLSQQQSASFSRKMVNYSVAMNAMHGRMSNEDAISYLSTQQAYEKQSFEIGQSSSSTTHHVEILSCMTSRFIPSMAPQPEASSQSVKAAQESLDRKRKTDKNIAKVEAGDLGLSEAVKGHNAKLAGHLKELAKDIKLKQET